jgi:hypothetical protein
LTIAARHALVVAAQEWANDDGAFFPKVSTWAEAARVSQRTIQRSIRAAAAEGLLTVDAYLRPQAGGQGASNYRFDPVLLGTGAAVTPARGDTRPPPAGGDRSIRPERSLNEVQNVGSIGRQTPLITEDCMRCGAFGPCRDDGRLVLCERCQGTTASEGNEAA